MKRKPTSPRRTIPPVAAFVLQPVTKRLARMEAILLEMRNEQDVKLKHIVKLEEKIEALTERVAANSASIRRLSVAGKVAAR